VYTWGDAANSRLGGTDLRRHHTPQQVKTLSDALRRLRLTLTPVPSSQTSPVISCGIAHTLVLASSGQLLAWGCGAHGQLGYGDLWDREDPVVVPTVQSIIAFAAGDRHSVAVFS
jgi:alpha-tubulin suppressor-like RCC1 family protein